MVSATSTLVAATAPARTSTIRAGKGMPVASMTLAAKTAT